MQDRAADDECDLEGAEGRPVPDDEEDCDGQVERDRDDGEQPDQLRSAIDALDEEIPGRVTAGSGQDEGEAKDGHEPPQRRQVLRRAGSRARPSPLVFSSLRCLPYTAHNGARSRLACERNGTLAAHGWAPVSLKERRAL